MADRFSFLLQLTIFLPILLGAALLLLGPARESLVRRLALAGFLFPALVSIFLWIGFSPDETTGYAYLSDTPLGLEFLGISLHLGLNGISLPLFVLAGVVGVAAGLYAIYSGAERLREYLSLLLIMQGGLMGVFASVDVFFFYFFHEVALIPTFIMIGIWGGRERHYAAMKMTIYLSLGALLSLLGLIAIYVQSGAESFDMLSLKAALAGQSLGTVAQTYTFALLLFGFGILVSLWPLHTWAALGYGAAPTSAAMLHAGVLKKFGLYGLIQIGAPLLPQGAENWMYFLALLALGNVVIIGFVTVAQKDLKQMIGYSSVMHMGYCFLGLACLSAVGVGGAVILMFAHGLTVALLFLLGHCIYRRTETFDMREMGGLGRQAPVLAAFFVTVMLASIGLPGPGLANFWGELTVFIGLWQYKAWMVVPAVLGVVISAVYGLRAIGNVFFGEPTPAFSEASRGRKILDIQRHERTPVLVLLALLILVGLWPRSLTDGINQAVTPLYQQFADRTPGAVARPFDENAVMPASLPPCCAPAETGSETVSRD